jgi:hypothetical protein
MQQWLAGTGRVPERAGGQEGGWAHSGQPAGPAGSQHEQLIGLNSKYFLCQFWALTSGYHALNEPVEKGISMR